MKRLLACVLMFVSGCMEANPEYVPEDMGTPLERDLYLWCSHEGCEVASIPLVEIYIPPQRVFYNSSRTHDRLCSRGTLDQWLTEDDFLLTDYCVIDSHFYCSMDGETAEDFISYVLSGPTCYQRVFHDTPPIPLP